jgi:Domain of Unknown Function (DUF349)
MKLLSRLFGRTTPSPPTPQERIATLSSGSAEEEGLRVAAIHRLPDGEALRGLAGLGHEGGAAAPPHVALTRAAQARMAQLIDEGVVDFSEFRSEAPHRAAVFAVTALCKDSDRLAQALALVRDPEQLAQLVLEGPSSRVRQMAAELVQEPAQLRHLLQNVRNKDKGVYKILKQKSDALNAAERRAAEIENEIMEACAALERHGQRTFDSFYKAAFEGLKTRWHSLSERGAADMGLRAELAIERCQEVIETHLRLITQQAAEQAALIAARELREQEQQAAQAAAAAQAQAQSEAEARTREEAAAQRAAEERQLAEKRAEEEKSFRQIGGLIRMALAAIRDGGTQRAARLRRGIEENLPAAVSLPANLLRQIQQLDEKLNELKQWKDYAVAPKRLELIADMEALIGSSEEPKALADRIKSLQEEWRTIGKGIVSEAPEEWQRFQLASRAAYEPCREYFEAQARQRQRNLDERRVVLRRVLDFESAQNVDSPDWRLLESVLRDAPREWRRHFPVDREAGRTVEEEFDAALARLQAKLDAWHDSNVADKQSLIKRARHLLTLEDSREAIDAVKRLQLSWKETGPAPGAQSQSLWNEFREVCDSVYQKRQQAYAEYTSGLEANKVKAVALCDEVERGAALSGTELLTAVAKIPEWRAAFEALDEMPRNDARGLQNRFARAIDSCRANEAQQRARDEEQSFSNLFEAARHIRAYQWAVLEGAESALQETLKQAADNFVAAVQHWPKGGLRAVKETLTGADSISKDQAARERALRILCIRAEIRSEVPTPPSDEALRREYQVQRLVQGMGQGIGSDDEGWDQMALEWIRIGAVAPDLHQSLQERFMRLMSRPPSAP